MIVAVLIAITVEQVVALMVFEVLWDIDLVVSGRDVVPCTVPCRYPIPVIVARYDGFLESVRKRAWCLRRKGTGQ